MDLATLKCLLQSDLEQLYCHASDPQVPEGLFRAVHLCWLDSGAGRSRLVRAGMAPLFSLPPFGIDFRSRRWWFYHPRLQVGAFTPEPGPSRWRDTRTLRLTYETSRLPWPLRALLYDEVKPLSPQLCLGLGGVNADRGLGEIFFFGLERVD